MWRIKSPNMDLLLTLAAALTLLIGLAHSYLGERYILTRLLSLKELPRVMGSRSFTRNTLRFAWHLTTVAWAGLGAILGLLAFEKFSEETVTGVIAGVFLIHGAVSLVASRGKHLSWIVFLAIALLALLSILHTP